MDRAKRNRLFWMSDKLLILSQELEKWADFCDWKALVGTELEQPWGKRKLGTAEFMELKAAYDDAGPVVAALGKMFRAFCTTPRRRSQAPMFPNGLREALQGYKIVAYQIGNRPLVYPHHGSGPAFQ